MAVEEDRVVHALCLGVELLIGAVVSVYTWVAGKSG